MGFSQTTTTGLKGLMIVRPQVRDTIEYFKISQNGCQIRIYPEIDEKGRPLPIRFGREVSDAGNWVNADHYGISMLGGGGPGKEQLTMLVSVKGDDKIADPAQRRGLRVWDKLRNAAYYATGSNQCPSHWHSWVRNNYPNPTVLGTKYASKAKPMTFARGCLTAYMTSKGPMRNVSAMHPRSPCLFFFGQNAQTALRELFMAPLPGAENVTTDDWTKIFKYEQQLADPQHGCLINFGRKGETDPVTSYQNQMRSPSVGSVSFGAAGKSHDSDGDQFVVEATLLNAAPYPIPIDVIREAWRHSWDELLLIHDSEKELLLALEVGFPDDLIIEAFKDEPYLLSERLLTLMREMQVGGGRLPAHVSHAGGYGYSPSYGEPAAVVGLNPALPPQQQNPFGPGRSPSSAPWPASLPQQTPSGPGRSPSSVPSPGAAPAQSAPAQSAPVFGRQPLSAGSQSPSIQTTPAPNAPDAPDALQNMLNTINALENSKTDERPF